MLLLNPLRSEETIVGRQRGCDLRIPSPLVSRRHCRLSFRDGCLILEDLASVRATIENRVLSLTEAAAWSGYSAAHLARLVKQGKLRTLRPPESRGRLSFRQGDLPRKSGTPHPSRAGVHELASRLFRGKERRYGQP